MSEKKLSKLVAISLESAIDNGYDDLLREPVSTIAQDLTLYDQDLENIEPTRLEPHITDWLKLNGKKFNLNAN